ncbi:MAG: ATP-dependent zinc metalloprotease FtsH [Candidatus Phytoplasma pruni]
MDSPLGILMYGIPGTGKTTLARALAKETNLPFFEVSSSIFSQKYKGIAPQLVKDLFMTAREEAQKAKGAIIFLDECETIFTDLSGLEAGSEVANVVNQFKTEMTSFENDPEHPIFIIGATNHIDQIDEAIKSRFTYNIEVKPGNKEERKAFLEFLINKRKNPYSEEAKQYLYEVINESLERLPVNHQFKKTNLLMAAAIFGIFFFFKNKLSANQTHNTTTWKGYLISFLIILGLLSFIYLCFFNKPKEPSSKYAGQLIQEIDKAIDKYDEIMNGYRGLKDNWEQELTKVEVELKELYKNQKLTQEQKAKIKELINQTETKINEIKTQKQGTENKINVLKEELKQKEAENTNKKKILKKIKSTFSTLLITLLTKFLK